MSNHTVPCQSASESTSACQRATARNNRCIQQESEQNTQLLGTYPTHPPLRIEHCIPPVIHMAPQPIRDNPTFLRIVHDILAEPPFQFEMTQEAASHILQVLQHRNVDVDVNSVIHSKSSICKPGSEFRSTATLEPLLCRHIQWEFTKKTLDVGATLHLKRLPSEEHRHDKNAALIEMRNRKKAKAMPDVLLDSIQTDLQYGFAAAIPITSISSIPNATVCPLGIAQQTTLAADGSRKE
jgi:hypothetical protein